MIVISLIRFVLASALLITLAHAAHFLAGRVLSLSPAQRVSLGRIAVQAALGLALLSLFAPQRFLFVRPALHAFALDDGSQLALSTSPQLANDQRLHAPLFLVALLLALFVTGALFLLVQSAVTFVRLRRLIAALPRLRRLGSVEVLLSESVRVPFSMSFASRALVVMPMSLVANPKHLRLALRHELLHHRRGDALWCVGLAGLRAVFFWVPSSHALSSELVELSELAVDEALLARRGSSVHDYAECLLAVASHSINALDFKLPNAVSGMADANSSQLKRRMETMLANQKKNSPLSFVFAALAIVACLSTAAVASRGVVAQHSDSVDAQAQALLEKALAAFTAGGSDATTLNAIRAEMQQCLALGPSVEILQVCYRNLAIADAHLGNRAEAAANFKAYLPYCEGDDCARIEALIQRYSVP